MTVADHEFFFFGGGGGIVFFQAYKYLKTAQSIDLDGSVLLPPLKSTTAQRITMYIPTTEIHKI